MNTNIKYVYNSHITDVNGITISDYFTVKYISGRTRKFICINRISKNVAKFIKFHKDNSISESITDKNGITNTTIMWK